MRENKIFVTVGTTSFDKLIETVTSEPVLSVLLQNGFTKLTMQIGRGKFEPTPNKIFPDMEHFRFKSNISDEIQSADLIVSHAGAGSILEALEAKKKLLVVINDDLMGNHQTELAKKLYDEGHLLYCDCKKLKETLETSDFSSLITYVPGNPENFGKYLNKIMYY